MDQRVTALNLSSLEIRGALSISIGNLTFLEELILDNNFFHGTIPYSLGNLSNLRILSASDNVLEGRIPEELGKLSKLEFLKLSSNKLSGEVPLQLFKISSIRYLNLASNYLNGSFPSDFGLNHSKLHTFVVAENQFFGPLPVSITNASGLVILDIGTNALSGPVPMNMGDLKHLQRLDISKNPLGTSDSTGLNFLTSLTNCTILRILHLYANNHGGALPNFVANLSTKLTSLRLDRNYISGEIPNNLENLFLSLQGNGFSGQIPEGLSNLISIKLLDLSRNNISGFIPQRLESLRYIQYLNLSFNSLEGEVPSEGLFFNSTAFSVTGNGKLCGGVKSLQLPKCQRLLPSAEGKKKVLRKPLFQKCQKKVIFGYFLHVPCIRWWHKRNTRISSIELTSDSPLGDQFPKISYTELFQATNGFSEGNLIARGRYSSVYKGSLNYNDKTVAVKVINLQNQGSRRSFTAECESLRNARHRNLVKIITACSSRDNEGNEFKALVYEFMAGGSLESWLHPSSSNLMQPKNLNLIQRLNIAIDVASALVYLHHFCAIPVIHRDIKPSNILLDSELCAHLGDFGSARSLLLAIDRSRYEGIGARTIELVGTVGYVALECGMGAPASTLVDVYSYGVLLLEMFTGKRPTNSMFEDDFSLRNYVKMALPDQAMRIADPKLSSECETEFEKCLASIFHIGVTCSAHLPERRMHIADVFMELQAARDLYLRCG
ncbi:unnamed protein product [Coffea canephora]|uniref:non-specific serine/threonine protein kinase n=1 Tax=Coffea canephora TaxID=49390 RepID=A0A068UTH5_COFCA|nr:unnamed protein product [Coffea canephora]